MTSLVFFRRLASSAPKDAGGEARTKEQEKCEESFQRSKERERKGVGSRRESRGGSSFSDPILSFFLSLSRIDIKSPQPWFA